MLSIIISGKSSVFLLSRLRLHPILQEILFVDFIVAFLVLVRDHLSIEHCGPGQHSSFCRLSHDGHHCWRWFPTSLSSRHIEGSSPCVADRDDTEGCFLLDKTWLQTAATADDSLSHCRDNQSKINKNLLWYLINWHFSSTETNCYAVAASSLWEFAAFILSDIKLSCFERPNTCVKK